MSRDPLRDALDRLAGEAPVELRRSEQVWARYRRRRRRTVAAGVGTAVAVVAAVALVAPLRGGSDVLLPANPAPSFTGTPGATAPPATTARPPGVGVPAPHGSGTVGDAGTTPAPSRVSPSPSSSGSGAWAAGVDLVVGPRIVRPFGEVIAAVFPYAGDNGIDLFTLDWGDGTEPVEYPEMRSCPRDGDRVVATGSPGGRHTYEQAGTYVVTVTVRFAGCGRPAQVRIARAHVVVADGVVEPPAVGGGPLGVAAAALRSAPAPLKRAVTVRPNAGSNTVVGYVIVEWGDGTATVLRRGVPSWCDVPPPPDPQWPAYVEHVYPRPGDYPVTAYSLTMTCTYGAFGVTSQGTARLRAGT